MHTSTVAAELVIVCFAALVFSAAVKDILTFTIPNRLSLAVALLYPVHVLSAPYAVDWLPAVGIAAGALAVGFVLFSLRYCGAGDAKLFAAVALWGGPQLIIQILAYTTLVGGVIALFIWMQHRFARAAAPTLVFQAPADPSIGQQQMPYGAAIAVAALYVAFTLLRIN